MEAAGTTLSRASGARAQEVTVSAKWAGSQGSVSGHGPSSSWVTVSKSKSGSMSWGQMGAGAPETGTSTGTDPSSLGINGRAGNERDMIDQNCSIYALESFLALDRKIGQRS